MAVTRPADPPGDREALVRSATVAPVRRRRRPSGDPPPLPRELRRSGVVGLVVGAVAVLGWVLIAAGTPLTALTDRIDLALLDRMVALRGDALTAVARALHALGSNWTERMLGWAVILVLTVFRRWRHLIVFVGALGLVESLTANLAATMQRMRPPVEILGAWEGFSSPSRPVAWFAAIVMGVALAVCVAGRPRRIALAVGAVAVAALGAARMYLGVDHPSDVGFAATIGVAVPLLAFRLFAPEAVFPVAYRRGRTAHLAIDGRRLEAIRTALQDQIGMVVREVEPFGLAGSAGSTPLRISVDGEGGPAFVFAKLYAANHLRADRWYKLGRALLYGRLEDEAPFENVRRLVQYEDYLLRVFRDAGLPVARPYGFVEITPEREYLLVTEFVQGARESGEIDIDVGVIDDALGVVRRMWDAGIAHRDVKPANVMVREGKVVLIDVAFGQVRPSPWREAVDLANMMLVLALRSEPELVYERATRQFTPAEIAEAFAATSEATRPSLRRMMRADGRDLLRRFRELAPPHPRIRVQRWNARRIWLTVRVAAIAGIVTAFTFDQLQAAGLL